MNIGALIALLGKRVLNQPLTKGSSEPMTWSDGTPMEWSDGTPMEWDGQYQFD